MHAWYQACSARCPGLSDADWAPLATWCCAGIGAAVHDSSVHDSSVLIPHPLSRIVHQSMCPVHSFADVLLQPGPCLPGCPGLPSIPHGLRRCTVRRLLLHSQGGEDRQGLSATRATSAAARQPVAQAALVASSNGLGPAISRGPTGAAAQPGSLTEEPSGPVALTTPPANVNAGTAESSSSCAGCVGPAVRAPGRKEGAGQMIV